MSLSGKYGHFDLENREYVISRPDTPRPWYNYLMNNEYVAMISNTGGGVSYYRDPRIYRVLRYRYQNVPYDRPGRYVYIRDDEDSSYWSATWAPSWTSGGEYSCRVGTNYQIITYKYNGIQTQIRYFVPQDLPLEIWDMRISNVSDRFRRIRSFSYAEFAFWGAMRDLMNIDNCPNVSRQKWDAENQALLHYSYNDIGTGLNDMHFVMNYAFHVSNRPVSGYGGDRDLFIGSYRDERNPICVERGSSSNYCENGGYPIGSLEHSFELEPGESARVVYQTGYAKDEADYRNKAKKYIDEREIDGAFENIRTIWKTRLDAFRAETPSREFDAVVNSFVQYQAATTLVLSRSISSYEWGIGRAIGFRDSCQDQLGMMHSMPEESRKFLRILAEGLATDGSASHNFNPFTGQYGSTGFYDDHNWLALSATAFIKETGDLDFAREIMGFRGSEKKSSMLEHLLAAQDYAWKHRGVNGLMQTGHADWNDSLNPEDKKCESVFTSLLYCASTIALIELLDKLGEKKQSQKLSRRLKTISAAIEGSAWDGNWYKRMLRKDGSALGSASSPQDEASIFLEPQAWAVISGIRQSERGKALLDIVEKKLGTEYGHKVMDIPFSRFEPELGSVGIYPPGIKENGSVFNHASSWMIYAEALLGRGGKAFEYFMRMSQTTKNEIADTHEVEPYVACQFISQKPYHIVGRGRNPWLTGTASWMAVSAMQGILGIRPSYDGLLISPSIPGSWTSFKVIRRFRGTEYKIQFLNPDGFESGIKSIKVAGREIPGNLIPHSPSDSGATIDVEVLMGSGAALLS